MATIISDEKLKEIQLNSKVKYDKIISDLESSRLDLANSTTQEEIIYHGNRIMMLEEVFENTISKGR